MSVEEWRAIPGYEHLYEVSSQGNVRSIDREVLRNGVPNSIRGRHLKPRAMRTGYLRVSLCSGGGIRDWYIHRIVAAAFIGDAPDGLDVCHYDGDRANNYIGNLRYDTRAGNMQDQIRHGTNPMTVKTHCPRGHALMEPNLVEFKAKKGHRHCLACYRAFGLKRKVTERERDTVAQANYLKIMGYPTASLPQPKRVVRKLDTPRELVAA